MQKIIWYIGVFFLIFSCNQKDADIETAQEEETNIVTLDSVQYVNAGITLGTPELKNMRTTVRVSGKVDVPPQGLVSISFPLGGYLKRTPLLPGYPVKKGQVIAVMEDPAYVQLQQDYLTAKAKMEYLGTDIQRQKELSEADAVSKKSYQQALSEYQVQQILIKSLEEKLRIISINPSTLSLDAISRAVPVYAPITGFVTKVNVNIGKYVNPADVLFELVDPDDIHAAITVFEKDMSFFKKGVRGSLTLTDKPTELHDVEVILVSKNISDNRSGIIHCHFLNPEHDLLPGMFLTGVFAINSKDAVAVPEESVVRYLGKEYVFVASNEKEFTMTEVQAGVAENGYREIEVDKEAWLQKKIAVQGAYSLLGKLKNKMED